MNNTYLTNLMAALKSENSNEWNIAYNYGVFMASVKAENDAAEKDAKKRDGDAEIDAAAAAENVSLDAFGKNRRSKLSRVYRYGKLSDDAPHMSAYPVGSVSALFELITAVKIGKDDDAAAAERKISAFIAENDITSATGAQKIRGMGKKSAENAAATENAAQPRRFTAADAEKIENSDVYAALFRLHETITGNADALKAFSAVTALVCPRYAEVQTMAAERRAAERAAAERDAAAALDAFADKWTAAENAAANAQNVADYKRLTAAAAAERLSVNALKGVYENAVAAAEESRRAAIDAGDVFDAAADRLSA